MEVPGLVLDVTGAEADKHDFESQLERGLFSTTIGCRKPKVRIEVTASTAGSLIVLNPTVRQGLRCLFRPASDGEPHRRPIYPKLPNLHHFPAGSRGEPALATFLLSYFRPVSVLFRRTPSPRQLERDFPIWGLTRELLGPSRTSLTQQFTGQS